VFLIFRRLFNRLNSKNIIFALKVLLYPCKEEQLDKLEVMNEHPFTYVDLFAGIGGFHAVLQALGGQCVFASEIDSSASSVYELNWGINPLGDITKDANDNTMNVPKHDVLVGGFPCQPFSKSGSQRGMDETRGTLYWNILKIIDSRKPALVLLENVRNLAGPRHLHEWNLIIQTLRQAGYRVSEFPWILSPHLLPPKFGGRPQNRERVFIVAVRSPSKDKTVPEEFIPSRSVEGWLPTDWDIRRNLPLEFLNLDRSLRLSKQEDYWLKAWNDFLKRIRGAGKVLPGFPLWGDSWKEFDPGELPVGTPTWKRQFLIQNSNFYLENREIIDPWAKKWNFYSDIFPSSRRKFEWQAGDAKTLESTLIHFRPSGIRVKRANYAPALVAMTQTTIVYKKRRRLSVREVARLQGLPDWFDFGNQADRISYKQLGNGVSIGAIWYILKHSANVFENELLRYCPNLLHAISHAPHNPDVLLNHRRIKRK